MKHNHKNCNIKFIMETTQTKIFDLIQHQSLTQNWITFYSKSLIEKVHELDASHLLLSGQVSVHAFQWGNSKQATITEGIIINNSSRGMKLDVTGPKSCHKQVFFNYVSATSKPVQTVALAEECSSPY